MTLWPFWIEIQAIGKKPWFGWAKISPKLRHHSHLAGLPKELFNYRHFENDGKVTMRCKLKLVVIAISDALLSQSK